MQLYNKKDVLGFEVTGVNKHYIRRVWVKGHNYPFGEKIIGLSGGPETVFEETAIVPVFSFMATPATAREKEAAA